MVVACWLQRQGRTPREALRELRELWRTTERSQRMRRSPNRAVQVAWVKNWTKQAARMEGRVARGTNGAETLGRAGDLAEILLSSSSRYDSVFQGLFFSLARVGVIGGSRVDGGLRWHSAVHIPIHPWQDRAGDGGRTGDHAAARPPTRWPGPLPPATKSPGRPTCTAVATARAAAGFDCSGSASYVLRATGHLRGVMTSDEFRHYGESGAGRWVSVYARDGHVFLVVAGLRFDTGWTGGQGNTGPRWTTRSRPADGCVIRHPAGL